MWFPHFSMGVSCKFTAYFQNTFSWPYAGWAFLWLLTDGWGGGQKGLHSLKFATHILQWWNLASYTLHKKEPKNIWITWHTPCVVLTSAFFHRKSANLAIFKNTDIDCILAHNLRFFKLFLSLRRFFNKHGYNFDNVSKIGFSSAS